MDPFVSPTVDFSDYYDAQTTTLGEWYEEGFYDPTDESWMWDYYSKEQYKRVCDKFLNRYWYREVGILPAFRWKQAYLRKLNEIMPKYRYLYKLVDETFADLLNDWSESGTSAENENTTETESTTGKDTTATDQHDTTGTTNTGTTETDKTSNGSTVNSGSNDTAVKERNIFSDFPATLLSGNADYTSTGNDTQSETVETLDTKQTVTGTGKDTTTLNTKLDTDYVKDLDTTFDTARDRDRSENIARNATDTRTRKGSPLARYKEFVESYTDIDVMILDELDFLFSCLLTSTVPLT